MAEAQDRAQAEQIAAKALYPHGTVPELNRREHRLVSAFAEALAAERAGRETVIEAAARTYEQLVLARQRAAEAERLVGAMRPLLQYLAVNHTHPGECLRCERDRLLADSAAARLGAEWAALRTLHERTAEMQRLFEKGGTGNIGGQMIRVFEAVGEVARARTAQ